MKLLSRHAVAIAMLLLAFPDTLSACPICNSSTGDAVRGGLFDASFLSNALAIASPFPILIGVAAWINSAPAMDAAAARRDQTG